MALFSAISSHCATGTVGYDLPQHTEYFKRTLSHSTLQTDEVCQEEAHGTLVRFSTTSQIMQVLSVNTSELSTNITGRRTLFLLGPVVNATW